jgi:type IV pilus assembly protein PilO
VLVVLVITLLCGHWLFIDPKIDELEARSSKEAELRKEWASKKHHAVNLDLYREQLAQADLAFGLLLRQLPNRIEANAFMGLLANLAVNQGLSGTQLSPGKEQPFEFYATLPVRISATGSFAQIGRVLAGISQLDRIAIVRDFSIRTESGRLALDATVLIFRFMDDDEVSALHKAAKGKTK